jgi:phosphoribosylformylglycinamidine cyclo-ligase
VHALAHITGGGIPENLARSIPPGVEARVRRASWTPPPEFEAVRRLGGVGEEEMFATFNMGVGMILVVAPQEEADVLARLQADGEEAWTIGVVQEGPGGVSLL